MRKIYMTDDGTHFDTEKAALAHENSVPIRKHILDKWENQSNHSGRPSSVLSENWLAFMVEVVQEYLPTQVATKRTKKVYVTAHHIKQVEALSHLRQKQVADIVGISTSSVWRIRTKQLIAVNGGVVKVPKDRAALLCQGELHHEDLKL